MKKQNPFDANKFLTDPEVRLLEQQSLERMKKENVFFTLCGTLIILICLNIGFSFYLWGQIN